jgi:biofilm PGA synthesis N-glycosyltransferase PgaC
VIFIITISAYGLLLFFVIVGFLLHPNDTINESELKNVTVIIPARNEEDNIIHCIQSITTQDFPKHLLQVIVSDDASNDGTIHKAAHALQSSGVEHIIVTADEHEARPNEHLSGRGKKAAIRRAMQAAKAEIIICRDADTFTMSDNWLRTIVNYMTASKKEFVICPVAIAHNKGWLSSLQEIEMSILSLFTISSAHFKIPFLCNGANLAFTKKLFYDTGAYQDHLHIASGDDIFFLNRVKQKNENLIGYLKNRDAVAYTFPVKGIGALLSQKLRWSSKVFINSNVINWLSALIITFTNAAWVAAIFYSVFDRQNLALGLFFILSKLLIDILLVFLASSFIRVRTGAFKVALMGIIYPFYSSLIAVLAVFIKPKWKSN